MASGLDFNHLYYFRYRALGWDKGTLHSFDMFPLCIPLDITPRHLLAVNTHFLSRAGKKRFVEWVLDNSRRLPPRRLARLVYGVLKADPSLSPFGIQAIRKYLIHRMAMKNRIGKEELNQFDSPDKVKRKILFGTHPKRIRSR